MESELSAPELRPPDSRLRVIDREHAAGRKRLVWMWLVITLLVVVAIAVMVVLPKVVEPEALNPKADNEDANPAVNQPTQQTQSVTTIMSHDAGEALKQFLRVRAEPILANAEKWAADDWQQALDTARAGDDLYGHKQYAEALSTYQSATQQLTDLIESHPQRLSEYLNLGQHALDQDQSDQSIEAFEQALAMAPKNTAALQGLDRARVRDQILRLMEAGKQSEQSNDPKAAATAYADAIGLDAMYQPAKEALNRVNRIIADLAFELAMSRALENLDAGQLTDAGQALKKAEKINPGSPAVADSRQRLRMARRIAALSDLRSEGRSLVSKEEWKAASDVFRNALNIDAEASFAVTGLAHAENRISLHAELDHYLNDLDRLASDKPLANAKKLIDTNPNIPGNEPQLAAKMESLSNAIRLAEQPVTLLLRSDNQTEITIYHVGQLGKLSEKRLTLRPGSYTVTGFCPGYRDVRKVVNLEPGSGETTLLLKCEELI